jgi:hypothetical protein
MNTSIFTYNTAAPPKVLAIYYNIYHNILLKPIQYNIDTHNLTIQQYHLRPHNIIVVPTSERDFRVIQFENLCITPRANQT